jgi:prolipoprotein diacylglyceryl transferase
MYPRLSDLINDLLGTNINLPIQSYGFFLALAFLTGAFVLYLELGRKEREGKVEATKKKILKGKPASINQLIITFVISLLIGFKLAGFVVDYSEFVVNPQEYVFSSQGSWLGGIIIAILYTYYFYYSKNRKKLNPPVWEEVTIHAKEQTMPILFIAVITGILGAKVFHWLENWDEFISDPIGSLISFSGLTFYGGMIAGLIGGLWYGIRNNIPAKQLMDAVAPALIIAYGIGRIGCQVSGDGDWGIVNTAAKPGWLSFIPDWLWAYDYPHNIINEGILIPGCTGAHCYQLAEPVFPTPVYETSLAVIIFIILLSLRKRIKIPGALFAIYLMFNGVERFFIEKIRVNVQFDLLGMKVTQAEIISTLLFLLGVILYLVFRQQYRKKIHS